MWRLADLVRRRNIFSLLFGLAALLVAAASPAWSQTYPFNSPGSVTAGAFTFTVGPCTYQLNNGSATNCNNDDLDVTLSVSRGAVTLTYVNSVNSANPLLSQATANGCTCVQFELTVADSNGISNATVSDTGIGVSGSTIDSWIETYGGSTKLAQAAITTTGSQTVTSAYTPAGNPTSLNLELGLGVNAAYQPGVFSLNTASVTFMGVTEPPPMLIFLLRLRRSAHHPAS